MSRLLLAAVLLAGCGGHTGQPSCGVTANCAQAHVCVQGLCVPQAPDIATPDAAGPADAGAPDEPRVAVDASPSEVSAADATPDASGSCGNGVVDPGEGCDDGNGLDDDGCNNRCALAVCGNGIPELGESCDGGPDLSDDRCTPSCRWVGFRQLAASPHHLCGLCSNGLVTCWGSGVILPPAGPFAQIALGEGTACGVRTDGSAVCWEGSLSPPKVALDRIAVADTFACGIERTTAALTCWARPGHTPPVLPAGAFAELAAGGHSACAMRRDGTIACFGDDASINEMVPPGSFKDLAVGLAGACASEGETTTCWGEKPGKFGGTGAPFVGPTFACGITRDGRATCWGGASAPDNRGLGTGYTRAAATRDTLCAIRTDGTIGCASTSLAAFSPTDSRVRRIYRSHGIMCVDTVDDDVARCVGPFAVSPNEATTTLALGDQFLCGLKVDGRIACWGATPDFAPAGRYRQLVAGRRHACALDFQDRATCWGETAFGQLDTPLDIFRGISASQDHTCGVTREGKLVCWGETRVWSTRPPPEGFFVEVAAGPSANCAVAQDGTVACWGQGQVVSEAPPRGLERLSVTDARGCGLDATGAPHCWGDVATAALPPGPLRAIDVGPTTCAIRADGRLVCVGESVVNADHSLR